MQPERWQKISQIFQSALGLKPEERVAYLTKKCGRDESLRREVELLIESHQKANDENFIGAPAVERAAPLLAPVRSDPEKSTNSLEKGRELGHYLVIDKLGEGGMGEVYLAKDTRLDRTVALKILPADIAADKRRMQRFQQEAKIASSLNQPNILTIFEFGEAESLNFIATEYVDGETLRHYLPYKEVKLPEILDTSIQILAALDAAHEAKIIHRDIKPENVMIRRRDRIIKILDFGLAKLTEKKASTLTGPATDAEAPTAFKTVPGTVMGTISYMSPEQAQGLPVDERTDLWSAGVMIYEMVAGALPFKGLTVSHTIVQILEKDPLPLTQLDHVNVPPELQRIVSKAMARNADERYQTAKDMLIDLRSLRKRLEVDAEIHRSTAPSAIPIEPDKPRGRKLVLWISLIALVLVLAGLIIGANAWRSARSKGVASAPAPVAERRLNYWMMVQKYRSGKPFENPFRLAGEINFERDYGVQLNVSSPQSGYLYILNEGPAPTNGSPSFVVLFPSPTANGGASFLAENQPIQIPQQGWFRLDAEEGTEKLWLVFSTSAMAELEAVKGFANLKDKGAVKNAALSKAVKEFLQTHSASRPSVAKSETQKETNLTATGNLMVHLIQLEHH
jgi:serine/threonine protein kinase